ncbi:MAG: DUF433 domain-containing protein [Nostoc sp.]|uniref:DUF433 domain-containing protein n=1 Tax=Nostoc sp. TaxID=1180 RepID=UPI002FF483FF
MVAIVDIGTLIVSTPQVAGGRPCIAGTRMTVQNLVMDSQAGLSPQDIVTEYPHLSLAQVYGRLPITMLIRKQWIEKLLYIKQNVMR